MTFEEWLEGEPPDAFLMKRRDFLTDREKALCRSAFDAGFTLRLEAERMQSVPAAGIELMKLVSEYGALRYKSGRYDATNTSLDSPRDPLDNAGNAGRAYDRICEAIAAAYGVKGSSDAGH